MQYHRNSRQNTMPIFKQFILLQFFVSYLHFIYILNYFPSNAGDKALKDVRIGLQTIIDNRSVRTVHSRSLSSGIRSLCINTSRKSCQNK